jgi:hypothetical protein
LLVRGFDGNGGVDVLLGTNDYLGIASGDQELLFAKAARTCADGVT